MKTIKLNSKVSIDTEKLLQSRMVILANSGGGKSYAVRKFAEEAVRDTQVIIIDPEGEFASLREKFDFILVGKGADVPAEVRSAELLAIKLLELGKSAIIDLYELHPQERQRFVKLFFDAMINAPKELYHPVFVVLDEAHEYAPEGKPSEATYAVEAMASRGRKRGFCLVPASQRISKLSKNVSAECNNKLIGRASQDIDMKRAGDELGFTKESLVKLRQLKPGEFFAFGPAISDEVIELKIGEVKTTHAKVSYKGTAQVAPPSSVIKKVLAELKDLPQEAEKEAKTAVELKQALTMAKRRITELEREPQTVIDQSAINKAVIPVQEQLESWKEYAFRLETIFEDWQENLLAVVKNERPKEKNLIHVKINKDAFKDVKFKVNVPEHDFSVTEDLSGMKLGKCAQMIYSYLLTKNRGMNKTQVAVATGYSQNSGGFNNSISELNAKGLIKRDNGMLFVEVIDASLTIPVDVSFEKWLSKLGACARAVWKLMLDHHSDETWRKEQIADETGYSVTSGGFNNSLSELSALGLIERMQGGLIRINPEVLDI